MTTPPRSVTVAEGMEILPSILARFHIFLGRIKTNAWLDPSLAGWTIGAENGRSSLKPSNCQSPTTSCSSGIRDESATSYSR